MSKYNVYIVAYHSDAPLEEKLDEMLMNYEADTDEVVYAGVIEDIEMENVSEELNEYILNGFKEDENV